MPAIVFILGYPRIFLLRLGCTSFPGAPILGSEGMIDRTGLPGTLLDVCPCRVVPHDGRNVGFGRGVFMRRRCRRLVDRCRWESIDVKEGM